MEKKLFTLPEHLSSLPVFCGVCVTRCLVFCVDHCLSLCLFFLTFVLPVILRYFINVGIQQENHFQFHSSLHEDLSKSPRHRPISVSPPLHCKCPIKTADPFRGIENDFPVVFLILRIM
jgi:hypothetical protein